MPNPSLRIRPALAFVLAASAAFVAAWIVLPAPVYALLILAVGAPESSVWLMLMAVVAVIVARPDLRHSSLARAACGCAALALGLSAIPFLQFAAVARRFDRTTSEAFGPDYPGEMSRIRPSLMRSAPLLPVDLLLGLRPGASRLTSGVRFAAPAGAPLTLEIRQFPGPGLHPVIVQIYGGAWRAGGPAANSTFARYFAGLGYVVFSIDYRHAPRWRWPAQRDDVRTALGWIRLHAKDYGADTSRIALVGRSSGAQLAMIAAWEREAAPVRAVVSLYGPVDLTEGWRSPPDPDPLEVRRIEEAFLGGTPGEQPEAYRSASPITYVTRPLPPVLLIVAGRDHVVLPAFGVLLRNRLRQSGTRAALLQIPWAEHGFDYVPNGPSGQLALYHIERFLAWALAPGRTAAVRAPRSR